MKQKRLLQTKSVVSLLCVTSLSAAMLAACGGADKPGNAAGDNKVQQGPLPLSVMMIVQGAEPPKKDSPVVKKIEEYTNTKLDISWVPASAYDDKVSATIASGNLPDLMLMRRNKDSAQLNAQMSGMFWDLTPFLKDTKNLSKVSEVALANVKVDGKIYGVPRERVIARYGMIFRKDWLDNVGLPVPKTVDDIYNTAKAFTLNDPDKNGKNDTIGIQEEKSLESLKQVALYSGAPNAWGVKDGKVTPDFMYPEYKKALDLFRKMNSEKLINSDFPIAKKYDAYFNKGKAGMYFSVIDDGGSRHLDLTKLDPKTVVDVAQNFDGPQGQRVRANNGYDSLLVIPKSSVKSEDKAKQIVTFLDKLGDKPMQDLLLWGIEGTDYTLEGGKAKKTDPKAGSGDIVNFKWDDPNAGLQGVKTTLEEKIAKLFVDNKKLAAVNVIAALISPTYNEKSKELDTAIYDAQVKFILGELDDKGWDAAVAKWRSGGGDKMIEEFTADYAKSKK